MDPDAAESLSQSAVITSITVETMGGSISVRRQTLRCLTNIDFLITCTHAELGVSYQLLC